MADDKHRLLYPIFLSLLTVPLCSRASPWQVIGTGSSLQVDHGEIFLVSPDTTFSCGFYSSGEGTNAYYFSIWFTHSTDRTVAWTANRGSPVNGHGSKIYFNREGNLLLTDVNGSTVWQSKTKWGKHASIALLNSGNLVVRASTDQVVWQSFDSPTDTLLPSQRLTRELRLVSQSGYHRLYFDNDNVLRLLFGDRRTETLLSWSQRFKIALGTARGLAYLHHECLEWIVHCDVKPENILLTRDFEAKIADFGLSKLSKRDNPSFNFTHMRGTVGYMAPEWALNLPINAKVDVYSYGVVLLEIVTGSRVSSGITIDEEEMDFMQFVQGVKQMLARGGNLDIVDARLKGHFNHEQATVMVKIVVSCLEERSKRPTMDQIVQDLMVYNDEDDHPAYFL